MGNKPSQPSLCLVGAIPKVGVALRRASPARLDSDAARAAVCSMVPLLRCEGDMGIWEDADGFVSRRWHRNFVFWCLLGMLPVKDDSSHLHTFAHVRLFLSLFIYCIYFSLDSLSLSLLSLTYAYATTSIDKLMQR